MKYWLVYLLMMISIHVNAQEEGKERKWIATATVAITPVPESRVAIQPGLEYLFNKRFSMITEYAIRLDFLHSSKDFISDVKYYRIKLEGRYHFTSRKINLYQYIGIQGSWAAREFSIRDGNVFNHPIGGEVTFFDKVNVKSPVTTISLQYGKVMAENRKLSLDFFTGVGARFINTSYRDFVNPSVGFRPRPADGPVFYQSFDYEGKLIWFQFNAGIRMRYALCPKK